MLRAPATWAGEGTFAADALRKLGEGLGKLGQVPEACVTLAEVGVRYPGSMAATQASVSMQGLRCQRRKVLLTGSLSLSGFQARPISLKPCDQI